MTMRNLWITLAVLTLLLAPPALAQEDERDEAKRDRAEDQRDAQAEEDQKDDARAGEGREDSAPERRVKVETLDGRAVIKMEREDGEAEDELKLDFYAREGWLKIEYRSENATAESDTELKVKLREVVEFEDQDGDGAYTPKVDRLVAAYAIEQLEWTVAEPEDVTSAGGVAGKKIVGTGGFPDGGSFGVVLYAYGGFAEVNGTTLKPSEVKIDLLLDGFPYRENGTLPALVLKTEQETEAKLQSESGSDDLRGVRAEANGYAAYFTWADWAYVDGVEKPVRVALLETESDEDAEESKVETKISLAYARGQHINHDPIMGIASADAQARDAPVPGAGFVAVALAAIAAVAMRRRRC